IASDEVETVTQAGLLHDIGKIGVPEAVLRKRAGLEPEEWALMRQHPMIGAQIVAPFEFFAGAALVIRHHHERWDGTGYPDGLAAAAARGVGLAAAHGALLGAALAWTAPDPRRERWAPLEAALLLGAATLCARLLPGGAVAYLGVPAWLLRRRADWRAGGTEH